MSKVKRQHYVPQFYLRAFAVGPGEPKLFVYDKPRRNSFVATVASVASGRYFYDVPDLEDPQLLEKNFARFEQRAAPALAKTLEALSAGTFAGFSDEDRLHLAFFIALLHVRTEEAREQIAQLSEELYRTIGSELPGADAAIQAARTPEGRARLHNDLLLRSDTPLKIAKALGPRTWVVFRNRSPWPLLTSDHPLVVESTDPRRRATGPCRPWAAISLPLSPEFLLAILPFSTDAPAFMLDLTRDEVAQLNLRQIDRATSQIFSSDGGWRLVEKRLREEPQIANPGRKRIEATGHDAHDAQSGDHSTIFRFRQTWGVEQ